MTIYPQSLLAGEGAAVGAEDRRRRDAVATMPRWGSLDEAIKGYAASKPENSYEYFRAIASDGLSEYRFGTGVARHYFCTTCGCAPYYVPRSDPDKIDVNARCLDGFDGLAITPKRFDGRNWEAAMQQDVPWR